MSQEKKNEDDLPAISIALMHKHNDLRSLLKKQRKINHNSQLKNYAT